MNIEQKKKIKILNAKFINNIYIGTTPIADLKEQYLEVLKTIIDWNDIDREDCLLLGFGRWTDEDTYMNNLWLIPYYLHSIIPEVLKVWDIDGEETQWNKQKDTDTRFGKLAYGIMVEGKCN